jgi:hypothetical protein
MIFGTDRVAGHGTENESLAVCAIFARSIRSFGLAIDDAHDMAIRRDMASEKKSPKLAGTHSRVTPITGAQRHATSGDSLRR